MTSSRISLLAVAMLAAMLAGCSDGRDPGFQGWVEADMIFVSPDESGRVTKLNVREGDEVKQGEQLYSVDDDLQKADLNQNKATLANAQQTYDRAASLRGTGAGTQANLDAAVSALRVAEARLSPRTRGWRVVRVLRRLRARSSRSISAKARWCRKGGRCCRSCRPAT
jgi:HlyD family secretion protein